MPDVTLSRTRIANGSLPPVCIVCGDSARHFLYPAIGAPEHGIEKYSEALKFFGYWISVLRTPVGPDDGSAGFPFCDSHQGYWRRHARLVASAPLVVAGMLIAARLFRPELGDPGWMFTAYQGGIFVYFLALLRAMVWGVRVTSGDHRSLVLSGASREFSEAASMVADLGRAL